MPDDAVDDRIHQELRHRISDREQPERRAIRTAIGLGQSDGGDRDVLVDIDGDAAFS